MWNRKELKAKGKAAFKANYWRCVLVALILTLIVGGGAGAVGGGSGSSVAQHFQDDQAVSLSLDSPGDELISQLDAAEEDNGGHLPGILVAALAGFLGIVMIIGLLINIFLLNPLDVGCRWFFTRNTKDKAELGEIAAGFERGYGRVVKTMFLTDLFLILWFCLLLVPGIIKCYSYRMVPYILADQPEMEGREAITRSREMMNGNKWRTFVLDLSFILWGLLSLITLGIVGIFYVNPYYQATNAELYQALKAESAPEYSYAG